MSKRLFTILWLLLFSVLPAAAQVYQVAEYIGEALAQASDEGETMECCQVAGQCQMQMAQMPQLPQVPQLNAPTDDQAMTDCPLQCSCYASAPALPPRLLTSLPPTSLGDEAPVVPAPVVKWTAAAARALPLARSLLPPHKTYLRHTCLRI
jgi:hypothetical protein